MNESSAAENQSELKTTVEDNETKKRALEILRVSATFLTQNQISIRNNLFPFIVLSILGYVAIVPNSFIKKDELIGTAGNISSYGVVPFTPIAISVGLIVIFMRFGFLLFHGLDLACSNKNLIKKSHFSTDEEDVLLQSFKDAYLIDTFLIFLNKPSERDERRIKSKRFAAFLVNVILTLSLIYSQFIVISAAAQKIHYWSSVMAVLYFVLFFIFASKVFDLTRSYPHIAEPRLPPRRVIYFIYGSLPIISALVSIRAIWA